MPAAARWCSRPAGRSTQNSPDRCATWCMPKWRAMSLRSAEAALRVSAGLRAGFRCEWQIAYWRFAEAGLCEVTGVADMLFDIRRYKPGDLAGLIALFRDTV